MAELSLVELDRQDYVDGLIHRLLKDMAGQDLVWDIEIVADIRDVAVAYLARVTNQTEFELYPWVKEDADE